MSSDWNGLGGLCTDFSADDPAELKPPVCVLCPDEVRSHVAVIDTDLYPRRPALRPLVPGRILDTNSAQMGIAVVNTVVPFST